MVMLRPCLEASICRCAAPTVRGFGHHPMVGGAHPTSWIRSWRYGMAIARRVRLAENLPIFYRITGRRVYSLSTGVISCYPSLNDAPPNPPPRWEFGLTALHMLVGHLLPHPPPK